MKTALSLLALGLVVVSCTPGAEETANDASVTAAEAELIDRFVAFARDREPDDIEALPLAEQIQLGLGETIHAVRPATELSKPDGWILDVSLFRAYTGPFSALELVERQATAIVTSVREHPHCASPPVPPPSGLARLRRISVQPDPDDIDTCLRWWTVDFFLNDQGRVVAITLDIWEP